MMYLEFLRVRRAFKWYAGVLVASVALSLIGSIFGHSSHIYVHSGTTDRVRVNGIDSLGFVPIPIDALIVLATLCSYAIATALAASFNRETQYAQFTFVRPIDRLRMALQIAAVDVIAIVAATLFAFACEFAAVGIALRSHAQYFGSPSTIAVALLGIGTAVMWYGILQAVSAWTSGKGGGYVGIAAATLGFALPLSQAEFLGPVVYVFRAILYVDPIAYFTSISTSGTDVKLSSVIGAAIGVRVLVVWLLALLALAIAALEWKRVEI